MAGKPTTKGKRQQEEIAELKELFLSYYKELPIKKAGADFIGRSIDTINDWESKDAEFADAVLRAKAEYARKHGKTRPDSLLPKLYPELKPEAVSIEFPTAITINHVHAGNHDTTDEQAG